MNLYTVKHNNKLYTVKAKDSESVSKFIKGLKDEMYNVTYKKNNLYHEGLVKASSEIEAKQKVLHHFQKKNKEVEILAAKLATESDFKPGKPVIDSVVNDSLNKQYVYNSLVKHSELFKDYAIQVQKAMTEDDVKAVVYDAIKSEYNMLDILKKF